METKENSSGKFSELNCLQRYTVDKVTTLQTHHVYSTLKRRANGRFHVLSKLHACGVFVGQSCAVIGSIRWLNFFFFLNRLIKEICD